LDLFVYEETGPESHFHFAINGKGGKVEGGLQKLAAGHYQVALPLADPGDYRIDLTEERRGRRIVYPTIGYSLPYDLDQELPRADYNLRLLNKLAQASGGEVNQKLTEASKKRDFINTYQPLRQLFMVWAAALFLLEIVARKLLFSEP
jgi:hypothetical protein